MVLQVKAIHLHIVNGLLLPQSRGAAHDVCCQWPQMWALLDVVR